MAQTMEKTNKAWLTPREAAKILKVSERTIFRKIEDGELTSRKEPNKRRYVLLDFDTVRQSVEGYIFDTLVGQVEFLQKQIEEKDRIIARLMENHK